MKVDALIRALMYVDNSAGNRGLQDFAILANSFGASKTLKAFLPALEATARQSGEETQGPHLGELARDVDRLAGIAALISTKAARDEVAELQRIVTAYPDVQIGGMRFASPPKSKRAKKPPEPLRTELVKQYQQRIEQTAIGSAELTALFETLAADKKVRAIEMAALSSALAYDTPPSTKRAEALRRIKQRHEAFLTSAAKSDALEGSSAT